MVEPPAMGICQQDNKTCNFGEFGSCISDECVLGSNTCTMCNCGCKGLDDLFMDCQEAVPTPSPTPRPTPLSPTEQPTISPTPTPGCSDLPCPDVDGSTCNIITGIGEGICVGDVCDFPFNGTCVSNDCILGAKACTACDCACVQSNEMVASCLQP